MQINDLFGNVPSIIGNSISDIYCLSKEDDIVYKLEYTGSSLKVISKSPYAEINNFISDKEIINEIENNNSLKRIIKNKTSVYMETISDYKIVLICDFEEEKEVVDDKLTLLIADDSPVITKFFTKTFESEFNILVAKNGEEAINLIDENINNKLFVGAFIDLQMPVKNGYDVLDYLSSNNLLELIPTSVISGEDSQNGIERATAYGIIDMLQKPFNADAARSIINKTIQHSKNYTNR